MIRKFLFASTLFFVLVPPASAERVWLVIGASDVSVTEIVAKAKPLFQLNPDSLIVQTHDCGDKKNVFAWVAAVSVSANAAQEALKRVHASLKDAYVKSCDAKPNTLLAARITAIDKSIADVPVDAVNWEDENRVSSAQPLADGRILVIARRYVNTPEDPLEGRRERVIVADSSRKRVVLEENCTGPGGAVVDRGRIAFHCAREQAGESLLHSVLVFKNTGEKITEIQHCRNPKWSGQSTVTCEAETVGSDGKLRLNKASTDLTIKMKTW